MPSPTSNENAPDTQTKPKKTKRGFASMDPERQRAIASMGGKAAHEQGAAHQFTPEEAREAGRKGGKAASRNRGHRSEERQQSESSESRESKDYDRDASEPDDVARMQSRGSDMFRNQNVRQ